MKVWTKICGLTRVEDAVAAVELGADAIGINFFPASVRWCPADRAVEIMRALQGSQAAVYGVFVREPAEHIAERVNALGLSGVQLHGGESDADVARVRSILGRDVAMIRAVAVRSPSEVRAVLESASHWRVLLDSARGGGSGVRFDEDVVAGMDVSQAIVAGGLTPENVAGIVARLRPYGVDTASGVERERGIKDRTKMREFIEHANAGVA